MKKLLKGIVLVALALTLVACGNNKGNTNNEEETVKVDLGALMEQIIADNFAEAAFGDYDDEYLTNFMELDPAILESYTGKYPMISMVATEIGMFEAKDGNVETVKTAMDAYKELKKENAWYPAEQANAENAIVFAKGNYVFYIMCENPEDIQAQIEAAFTK